MAEFRLKLKNREIDDQTPVRTEELKTWMMPADLLESGLLAAAEERNRAKVKMREAARTELLQELAISTRPLTSLPDEFGDSVDRALAYADYVQQAYSDERPRGLCVLYPNQTAQERATFYFAGDFYTRKIVASSVFHTLLRLFVGRLSLIGHFLIPKEDTKSIKVQFYTAHDFSLHGARIMRRRWFGAIALWWLAAVATVGVMFSAFWSLMCLLIASDHSYSQSEHDGQIHMFQMSLLAAVLLGTSALLLFRKAKDLRLPSSIINLEKRPFRLRKITWVEFDES